MDLKPDQKEIENLLRYGAYAFIDNDGDIIEEMDINELFTKKVKGSKKKGKSLNKSTFNVDEYEKKLDKLNDEDFWKEILPSLETVSVQALEKKLKFDRADIIKNETTQSEFLENLKKLVNQLVLSCTPHLGRWGGTWRNLLSCTPKYLPQLKLISMIFKKGEVKIAKYYRYNQLFDS